MHAGPGQTSCRSSNSLCAARGRRASIPSSIVASIPQIAAIDHSWSNLHNRLLWGRSFRAPMRAGLDGMDPSTEVHAPWFSVRSYQALRGIHSTTRYAVCWLLFFADDVAFPSLARSFGFYGRLYARSCCRTKICATRSRLA